jgi:hypothetical protein
VSRNALARLALLALVSGCGGMLPNERPSDAVRGALDRIAAHDLAGGSVFTCRAQRDPNDFPFTVPGIFFPLAQVPTPPIPQTLALITIDARDLRIEEPPNVAPDDLEVEVQLSGSLWLTLDPEEVESAVRAAVRLQNDPLDEALLEATLAGIRGGPVELPVDQTVRVVREDGGWRVCDPLPQR